MGRSKKWDTHSKWLERERRRKEMGLLDAFRGKKQMKTMRAEKEPPERQAGRSLTEMLSLELDTVVHRQRVHSGMGQRVISNGHSIEQWCEDQKAHDQALRLMEEAERQRQWQQEERRWIEQRELQKNAQRPGYWVDGQEMERYQDALGRVMWRPKPKPEPEPEPKVEHKAGHFPIDWMIEAAKRATESDDLIRIESHETCVIVFGIAGETYAEYKIEWLAMEKAEVNPLLLAIENVERQIRVQLGLKAANG